MVHAMTSKTEQLEDIVRRQTKCVEMQMEKIAALENEITILKGGLQQAGIDAVLFLRSVYSDSDAPLNLRISAAAVVAKIQATPKVVNQGFVLFDFLEKKRLERAALRLEAAKTIDVDPNPAA
jgi:hypothetical protein